MAKRGRKKKFKVSFNVSPETIRSVVAVLLFLLSVMIFISFLAPDYTVNFWIKKTVKMVFGNAWFVVPVITAIGGSLFIDSINNKMKELRVIVGLFIFLLALSGFMHLFVPIEDSLEAAKLGSGGGYLGHFLSFIFARTISKIGAFFVMLALVVVGFILVFDVSIDKMVELVTKYVKIPNFKKTKDEVEITPGINDVETQGMEEAEEVDKANTKSIEPSFEIIPTMAEPQVGLDDATTLESPLVTISPSLPYVDKVWEFPPPSLLKDVDESQKNPQDNEERKQRIVDTLNSFGIPDVTVVKANVGPSVTKFILDTPTGVRVSKISNLQNDLALALESPNGMVRIEAPIPGTSNVGIEVPNKERTPVGFKGVLQSEAMKGIKSKLAVILGKDVGGTTYVYDIAKMPHMLIAGATGSGKSVFIHNLIFSILFRATPQEVKFILIDPKKVEFNKYEGIPHLYTPIVTEIDKSPAVFKWAVAEMERRLHLFSKAKVRNIESYNSKSGFQVIPYIVIVVDEFAELMVADPSGVEKSIIRLGQMARAAGIHLVLAAQRPDAKVITGLIKANIPCRVAFNVIGQVNSRVIIDQVGAEKLLGQGDMLFVPPDTSTPVRLQGAYISDDEIEALVNWMKERGVEPEYKEELLELPSQDASKSVVAGGESVDDLYDEALEIVVSSGKGSASLLQRRLSIGYARAARIIDELEQHGVVGPPEGSKPREVLVEDLPSELETPPFEDNIVSPS